MAATARSSDTVNVMCRWPNGIVLSLYDEADAKQRAEDSRDKRPNLTLMQPVHRVRLNGMNRDPRFHAKEHNYLGKAGRTVVDAAFWDAWKAQNARSDLIRNHIVFAEVTAASAESRQRDFARERMGREGLDPDNLGGGMEREPEAAF